MTDRELLEEARIALTVSIASNRGCAELHHGVDVIENGDPPWLADLVATLERINKHLEG
jgi:hypothetical protein